MAPVIVKGHECKPAVIGFGFTALESFYSVTSWRTAIKLYFNHDEASITIIINSALKIKIKYANIAFVNIQNNHLIIAYNYTPYTCRDNESMESVLSEKTLKTELHKGSAIHFQGVSLPAEFEAMLDLRGVKVVHKKYNFPHTPSPANFVTIAYSAECLHSLGYPAWFLLAKFKETSERVTTKQYYNMYFHVNDNRHLTTLDVADYPQVKLEDENYVKYRSMTVTPTGITYHPPAWKISNFALRQLDPTRIISVTFSDDDGGPIRDHQFIKTFVVDFCRNGFDRGSNHYSYFLASSSKFREHSHYFYKGSKLVVMARWRLMGTYERALPAKIGARVGLNSSSVRTGIPLDRFKVVPDIKSRDLKYNFTDGCGLITRAFAVKLQRKFGLKFLPSAFQIRFPGFKGVVFNCAEHLSFYDPLDDDDEDDDFDVKFTREMRKFYGTTKNATLDVIKFSSPVLLNLNKNMIEVLCQNAAKHGDAVKTRVEGKIREMADRAVKDSIDKCVDPSKFIDTLEGLPKYMEYSKMKSYTKSERLSDPFLRSLVQADASFSINRLNEKQQIPFDASFGRNMIGVPDFHGYLKENQVYIQYTTTFDPKCKEKIVHKGPVAVTRSPLYHLGGIQFVEAVDVPYYTERSVCDVIVFPIKGKMPIQESIAKGDLDGDEYAVFWDPDLMMPSSQTVPSYESAKAEDIKKITLDQLQEEYPKFISEFMIKTPVGIYANNHSHLAEIFGYEHPDVITAANKNEDSLVYFKSGIPPAEPTAEERAIFIQEHMKRDHVPAYRIDNVLSKNHRLFQEIHEDIEDIIKTDETSIFLDPKIDVKGWDIYLDEARDKYRQFVNQIKRILEPYGPVTMAEVFSGKISEFQNSRYNRDDDSFTSVRGLIQTQVSLVMKTHREGMLDDHVPRWRQDMLDKDQDIFSYYSREMPLKLQQHAVAFYNVAYADGECLAFPWILWDVIDHVRRNSPLVDSFFELGVYDGADPKRHALPQSLTDALRLQEPSIIKRKISRDIFRFIYHLKHHVGLILPDKTFKETLLSIVDSLCKGKNLDEITFEKRLAVITAFIRIFASVDTGQPETMKICKNLLLQMAFQNNPQIFKTPFKIASTFRLQKFVIKVPLRLTQNVVNQMSHHYRCQITFKPLALEVLDRYRNIFVSRHTLQVQVLLGYGSTADMRNLREFFTLKLVNWKGLQYDSWHADAIDLSAEPIRNLMSLKELMDSYDRPSRNSPRRGRGRGRGRKF